MQFSHRAAIVISNLTPLFAAAIRNSGYYELINSFIVPTANLIVLPLSEIIQRSDPNKKKSICLIVSLLTLIGLLGWINDSFVAR